VPLSDECLHDAFQFNFQSNAEMLEAVIQKLWSQQTASFEDIMEHVPWVDVIFNATKQLTQGTVKWMEPKLREGDVRGRTNKCSYTCWEVGHPTCTSPHKEEALAAWKENKAAPNKGTEKEQTVQVERHTGLWDSSKRCGNAGGGGGSQQSLRWVHTSGG